MNARTRSRKAVSIASNQSAKSGPASSASGCTASRFVVGLVMAWSPARRANAGIDRVGQPGDYATPNSNQPRDATVFCEGRGVPDEAGLRTLFKALFALVIGRQTAGRVMPARWAMREADFEVLLHLVERLGGEQRAALGRALASASGEPEAVRLLEEAFAAAPRCPHCAAARLQRWGHASGLRRYRCAACRKTFNALTGTSLARLRKKACWLRYGEALAAGMTLAKAAAHCGVHLTTSFRWRHRFLRAPAAAREALGGVVEADETFFRRSEKGSRRWRRAAGPLERRPRRRGERASKRGP